MKNKIKTKTAGNLPPLVYVYKIKYFFSRVFSCWKFWCGGKKIIFLGLSIFILLGFSFFQKTSADDTAQKIKDLEEKAKIYQQIIDIKQKQQDTLENQTALLEAEASKIENEIELKKSEIDELNSKINSLEQQIEDTEVSITLQKKILADLLQAYYENKDQNVVTAFLSDKNLSAFMSKDDRFVQVEDKTNEILKNIKSLKEGLESEKKSVEDKKKEITDLFYQLQEKSSELQDKKDQKEALITQTQGEQKKYEGLLERVEEQKQELLNIDELGGNLSADSYPKPPSSAYASASWYYSQRDSRWGNQTIGNTKTLMKSYGCAVTAVAMAFTYHGDSITPGSMARKKIFSSDLIVWPASSFGKKVSLSGGYSHGNINWKTVDNELKNKNPVIVYIKKTKGSGGHYVVIHTKMSNGKYVVHDPYWGANIYLDTTRALMGQMAPQSGTQIDQMIIYK
ncbi:MAG: C39 family peptidase [Patescibacteria group bacterium]